MDYQIPRVSLEQWLAFKTVVDRGSFALAAEVLNKSQSAVSYAINRLNAQLPAPVLALKGRRAVMTESGQVLYRHAEQIIRQAGAAEAVARSLALGFESEITLALDALLEIEALICVFEEFSRDYPHTRIRVLETSLSGTSEALLEKRADLVIGASMPVGFTGRPLGQVTMIPVAASHHPLVAERERVSEVELKGFRQVVLRDTGTRREKEKGQDCQKEESLRYEIRGVAFRFFLFILKEMQDIFLVF